MCKQVLPYKLLFVISSLNMGGTELRLLDIMAALNPDIFRPHLFVAKHQGALINRVPHTQLTIGTQRKRTIFALHKLWHMMRENPPDVVWCVQGGITGFFGQWFAHMLNVSAVVMSLHGSAMKTSELDSFNRYLARRINTRLVTVSRQMQMTLVREGLDPAQITTIRNGVDTDCYHPNIQRQRRLIPSLGIGSDAFIIATVGNLRYVKGHELLIEAMPIVKRHHPDVVLIIIGEGVERSNLERQIARLNATDYVKLLGRRDDVADLLQEADLFAFSSRNEGLPNAILEAMATGLPIISTNVGGIAEIVTDTSAILTPPGNSQALAEAISKVVADPALRQQMGTHARAHIVNHFSFNTMIQQREDLLTKILNTPHID